MLVLTLLFSLDAAAADCPATMSKLFAWERAAISAEADPDRVEALFAELHAEIPAACAEPIAPEILLCIDQSDTLDEATLCDPKAEEFIGMSMAAIALGVMPGAL